MTWSQGTIVVENDRIHSANLLTPIEGLCGGQSTPEDARATSPVVSDIRGHRAIIEDFVQAIASGGVPICDGHQARRSVQLVNAIYKSSRTGLAVRVNGRKFLADNAPGLVDGR
jgi:predicted dehydrogenase